MKMLTGLLPTPPREVTLLSQPVDRAGLATRRRIGCLSQSSLLYNE
jgi:ABC-type multidrug transport system ATPase subunit